MTTKTAVPDAWDDDWESLANRPETTSPPAEPVIKLTKSQKRVQHQELQKQLWASAENPSRNLWLEAQGAVPLKQEIKAPMMLLSRKAKDTASGAGGEDEDSEEEARKKKELDFEERKRKAVIEREEKVRKYAEARERIMGSATSTSAAGSRESSQGRDTRKSRGKAGSNLSSRPTSAGQSPARHTVGRGDVFDPEDMGRRLVPRRETNASPKEGEPVRQPRGPDGSGRGGFGFGGAARGGRAVS